MVELVARHLLILNCANEIEYYLTRGGFNPDSQIMTLHNLMLTQHLFHLHIC